MHHLGQSNAQQIVRVGRASRAFEPIFVAKARVLSRLFRWCALEELYALPTLLPLRTSVPGSHPPLPVAAVHGVTLAIARGHGLRGLIGPLAHVSGYRRIRFDSADLLTAAVIDTLIHTVDRQVAS